MQANIIYTKQQQHNILTFISWVELLHRLVLPVNYQEQNIAMEQLRVLYGYQGYLQCNL